MRALVGVLAVVAGCYSPTLPSGVPCDPATGYCPRGQMCVLSGGAYVCSTMGDTLPDASDDTGGDADAGIDAPAPCSNPVGHDEDHDQIDDACDICPHVGDLGQDADNDGVGDACDPHPGLADRIARFDSFASTPSDWTLPAEWSIASDGLVGTSTGTSAANLNLPVSASVVVFSHTSLSGTAAETNAGVVMNFASSTEFYKCGVHVAPRLELVKFPGMTLGTAPLPSTAWLDADLEAENNAGALRCRATRSGNHVDAPGNDTSLQGTRVGVRIREGTARFEYLVVITRQP